MKNMPLSISIPSTPNKTGSNEIYSTFTTHSQNIMSPEYLPSEISMEDDFVKSTCFYGARFARLYTICANVYNHFHFSYVSN